MAGRIVPGRLAAAQCSRSILDLIDPFSIEFLGCQMMTSDWQSPDQRYVAEHLQAQVTPKGKVLQQEEKWRRGRDSSKSTQYLEIS